MPPRRAAPSGIAVSLGRVFLGPWPIYPRAIATLVV